LRDRAPSAKSEVLMEVMPMAIDPVCGMTVDEKTAPATSEYKGSKYFFCAKGCKVAFDKDPEKYLSAKPGEKKMMGH
jgi:YHS domain-containing protein